MEKLNFKGFKREVDNSLYSVVFFFFLLGSPTFFDFLTPLISYDISYYSILLDGHGGKVQDFSKTSMKKRKQNVSDLIEYLISKRQKIIFVGHSMGTLLGIKEAVKHKEIEHLILLNPPLVAHYPLSTILDNLKAIYTDSNDPKIVAIKESSSVTLSKNLFLYLGWIPRFIELLKFIKESRTTLKNLTTPTIAFHSLNDELVSNKSKDYLDENKNIKVLLLNSGHYYYEESDKNLIIKEFQKILENL